MPSYSSNAIEVTVKIKKRLENIEGPILSNIVRTAATTVRGSNLRRIHKNGKDVKGNNIGEYKEGRYKELRKSKGFPTDKVDLVFTSKLESEFILEETNDKNIGVGFSTEYGANLRTLLEGENMYNKKIWGVTKDDEKAIKEEADDQIKRALNG